MKIAILNPSSGSRAPFRDLDPPCEPSRYLPEFECVPFDIEKKDAVRLITRIAAEGFDVAINLCDGASDEDTAGIEVVQTLERRNMAFTGAGSLFYDPSREAMKMACHSAGVKFPAYVMARVPDDAWRALARLRFPMIVKHPKGYASEGMTKNSRVTDESGLRSEVARIVREYGAALVEEFIEGREFTVLVTEPRGRNEDAWVFEPVEFCFPAGESFKHFDLKWKEYGLMQTRQVDDEHLAARLREASGLTFAALGGSGYARCDLRVDRAGEVYLLEINPNCGVFYPEGSFGSADFILAADAGGHRAFLLHVIDRAIRRRERARRVWELEFTAGRGFGLIATRNLKAGEIVERYEERPQRLVSRRHVDRHWRGARREWFDRYAWPLAPGLYALWSADPEEWRPINHGCDPNTSLEGLDVVARRDVAEGEEFTVDYATFCGPEMPPFECECGAPECRGTIVGRDRLLPAEPAFEISTNAFGGALVARRSWSAGDLVIRVQWEDLTREPSRWTVQVGQGEHATPGPLALRFVNHSCAPNVLFDVRAGVLRALRDIAPGEELRCFYPSTEWIMAESFECACGEPECLGFIAGASGIGPETLLLYELSSIVRGRLSVVGSEA